MLMIRAIWNEDPITWFIKLNIRKEPQAYSPSPSLRRDVQTLIDLTLNWQDDSD
jgi:hypothetical protein